MLPMEEIARDIDALNEDLVKRLGNAMAEPAHGEEILGASTPRVQRLWALAIQYGRLADLTANGAKYDSETTEERIMAQNLAHRWESMSKVVRMLAWIETHDTLGERSANVDCTGIRKGYVIVSCEPDSDLRDLELLGKIPIASKEHLEMIKATIKLMAESVDALLPEEVLEGKKRKVQ